MFLSYCIRLIYLKRFMMKRLQEIKHMAEILYEKITADCPNYQPNPALTDEYRALKEHVQKEYETLQKKETHSALTDVAMKFVLPALKDCYVQGAAKYRANGKVSEEMASAVYDVMDYASYYLYSDKNM